MSDKHRPAQEDFTSPRPTDSQLRELQDRLHTMLDESHVFLTGAQAKARQEKEGLVTGRQDRSHPEMRTRWRGMATSTPSETEGGLGATTEMLGRQFQDRETVDNLSSPMTLDKCRVPPMSPPKFETGGDWRCFLA